MTDWEWYLERKYRYLEFDFRGDKIDLVKKKMILLDVFLSETIFQSVNSLHLFCSLLNYYQLHSVPLALVALALTCQAGAAREGN